MVQQLWFGTKQKFMWVPMPSSGIQRQNVFSSSAETLDRGGAYVSRSVGRHAEFDFSFGTREASGVDGLNVFQQYATGMWDDYTTVVDGYNPNNLKYFCDPMSARENLFSPHWAAPMLALSGDYPHIGKHEMQAATVPNVYNQPSRTVTYNVTSEFANTLPIDSNQNFVIPIPPGNTLYLGWSGSVTGTAVVRVEAHTASTGAIVATNVAPQSTTGATRMANSFNGDIYDYVTVGLSSTTTSTSTASVTSMMAQIFPNTYTPTLTGRHVPGVGQTGCEMSGDMIEEYVQADDFGQRRLKGLSFGMVEIGAWLGALAVGASPIGLDGGTPGIEPPPVLPGGLDGGTP